MIKKYLNSFFYLVAAFVFTDFFSQHASAQIRLEVEGAYAWQIRNVNRVPVQGGTEFDLARFSRGPIFAPRYLLTWDVDSKHSIRTMIFPFQTSIVGNSSTLHDLSRSRSRLHIPARTSSCVNSAP